MSSLLTSGMHYDRGECGDWSYRGDWTLTDGTVDYGDTAWTLLAYRDIVTGGGYYGYFKFDLGAAYALDYVRFGYAVWSAAHIYSPSTVIVQGSSDDFSSDVHDMGTFVRTTNWSADNTSSNPVISRWSNNLDVSGHTYRYVRFKIYYNDPVAFDTAHAFQEFEVYGDAPAPSYTTPYYLKGKRSRMDLSGVSTGLPDNTGANTKLDSGKRGKLWLRGTSQG